jgi:hypothetical protein
MSKVKRRPLVALAFYTFTLQFFGDDTSQVFGQTNR